MAAFYHQQLEMTLPEADRRVRGLSSLAEMFPTRTEWWVAKIIRNMERDAEVTRALQR
jgi:DNA mismatch endonuclease (patch repair protein)